MFSHSDEQPACRHLHNKDMIVTWGLHDDLREMQF